jgi:hypothetical protein
MKAIITLFLSFAFCLAKSQSVVGTWQIIRQSNCLEAEVSDSLQTDEDVMTAFSSKSNRSPKVMSFNSDNTGEEGIKTLDKKKMSGVKKFHYKQDGSTIYILDKKSRLITSSLVIETLTSDSLVYHPAGKACERIFLVRTQ